MNVLDMLSGVLPAQASTVASQVGATPEQTQAAMQASVPLILNALHQNTQQEGGEEALGNALQQHDGSSLDSFAQGQLPDTQDGQAIVQHAFGAQAPQAANAVAQHAGIDPQMAMRILSMVAPLVLAALGRGQSAGGASGGLGGLLSGLLNGSGGLGGMLGGLLGGGQSQSAGNSSGGLGGMLGGLLGGGQDDTAQNQAQTGNRQPSDAQNSSAQSGSAQSGNVLDDLSNILGGRKQ